MDRHINVQIEEQKDRHTHTYINKDRESDQSMDRWNEVVEVEAIYNNKFRDRQRQMIDDRQSIDREKIDIQINRYIDREMMDR